MRTKLTLRSSITHTLLQQTRAEQAERSMDTVVSNGDTHVNVE